MIRRFLYHPCNSHVGTESTLITFADRACAHGTLPDPQPDAVEALDYEGACV